MPGWTLVGRGTALRRYTAKICQQKSAQIYQDIYDNYWGAGRSIYAMAA
jgi:hypothetical protein